MIEQLGDLLRLSLDSHGKQSIRLRDELAFTNRYLALQKIRFGDRLPINFRWAAPRRWARSQLSVSSPSLQQLTAGLSFQTRRARYCRSRHANSMRAWYCRSRMMELGLLPGWSMEEDFRDGPAPDSGTVGGPFSRFQQPLSNLAQGIRGDRGFDRATVADCGGAQ